MIRNENADFPLYVSSAQLATRVRQTLASLAHIYFECEDADYLYVLRGGLRYPGCLGFCCASYRTPESHSPDRPHRSLTSAVCRLKRCLSLNDRTQSDCHSVNKQLTEATKIWSRGLYIILCIITFSLHLARVNFPVNSLRCRVIQWRWHSCGKGIL